MSENIRISQKDNNVIIYKNENFLLMIKVCKYVYERMILDLEKESKIKHTENLQFSTLISNICSDKKTSTLNFEDAQMLSIWIDLLCNLIIEKNTTDLKNQELQRFFKITTGFNKKLIKILKKEKAL